MKISNDLFKGEQIEVPEQTEELKKSERKTELEKVC